MYEESNSNRSNVGGLVNSIESWHNRNPLMTTARYLSNLISFNRFMFSVLHVGWHHVLLFCSIQSESIEFNKFWNPKLYIENSLGDPKEQIRYRLLYNDKGEAFITEKRVIKGTFMENLELDDFPFDVQVLNPHCHSATFSIHPVSIFNAVTSSFPSYNIIMCALFFILTPAWIPNIDLRNKCMRQGLRRCSYQWYLQELE